MDNSNSKFSNISGYSILNATSKELLNDLSNIVDELGNEFAPVILEELQARLAFIINNFDNELNQLITNSFESHKIIYSQLNLFMSKKKPKFITANNTSENHKDKSVPSYLQGLGLENEKHTQ